MFTALIWVKMPTSYRKFTIQPLDATFYKEVFEGRKCKNKLQNLH